jgi:hypothetical protein
MYSLLLHRHAHTHVNALRRTARKQPGTCYVSQTGNIGTSESWRRSCTTGVEIAGDAEVSSLAQRLCKAEVRLNALPYCAVALYVICIIILYIAL